VKSLDKGVCGRPAPGEGVDGGVKPVVGEAGSDELAGEIDPKPPALGMPPPPEPSPDEGMLMPPPPLIGMVGAPLVGEKVEAT
jgi:hypothetical protein